MNIEDLRTFCLQQENTTEDMPFGNTVLVFRLQAKIYALLSLEESKSINLKCDPEKAIALRNEYNGAIIPGYHMNKKYWNTLYFEQLPEKLILELIRHSYDLVNNSLPKKLRINSAE